MNRCRNATSDASADATIFRPSVGRPARQPPGTPPPARPHQPVPPAGTRQPANPRKASQQAVAISAPLELPGHQSSAATS
jgi:hypothetical protein